MVDPTRRTWLAAERTWLAWWRTGLGASAVAIAVGRVLPDVTGGSHLPFKLLGLAYGILAVAILAIGALRQAHVAEALRRGYKSTAIRASVASARPTPPAVNHRTRGEESSS